ncbi:MAG: TM0106 family RecB-like putative nuclease [Actinomycetota bacterium]|nr:TM0106 family RecB-like putative nuclease [Actinomycetota bacterium]
MRILDGEPLFSATDLVGFAACGHLTQLELAATRGEIARPNRSDPLLDILVRRGEAHEADLLADHPGGVDVVRIVTDTRTRAGIEAGAAETEAAMRRGAATIYQATFFHHGWVGHADFVDRVDTPSALGDWSYEAMDAKLTTTVRASALLQLCEYSEQLERVQGRAPEHMYVVTGDNMPHTFRVADYSAYHRTLKERFAGTIVDPTAPTTYPEPVGHCSVCRWWSVCTARRRADDHLSLVAGIRTDQRKRLTSVGVNTRSALGVTPTKPAGVRIAPATYERLHLQAALQVLGEGRTPPLFELIEPAPPVEGDAPQGLAILPLPSRGDLFLDLEGDPYAAQNGLEYLFGLASIDGGACEYHPFWGHSKSEERRAFESAVDFITERRRRFPDMHVYHYAPHEPSAFRRLMGEHGTREDEVDDLLRGEVFVDLFRAVRQGIRLSVESYSLKQVEKLYFVRPPGEVMDAGSSIVTYERYLESGDRVLLDEIAAYNRDDCETLVGLREWLEARRSEAELQFGPIARPLPPELPPETLDTDERAELVARLLQGVPDDPDECSAHEQSRFLLAQLLEWHRREAKPEWWQYFERINAYEPSQFVDDAECIGGLVSEGRIGTEQRSYVYRLRFEPQDHKFRAGDTPIDPATEGGAGTIVSIDESCVELKRGKARDADPLPTALMPGRPISTNDQRDAIAEVASWVVDNDIDADGEFRAVRDLLLGLPPRIAGRDAGDALQVDGEATRVVACRLAVELDHGCLPVQGPPGAGKTFTGARMIVALLNAGRRVGVAATTHSAITKLLQEVADAAKEAGVAISGMQKIDADVATSIRGIKAVGAAGTIESALHAGEITLAAGTAWLWARPGLRESVDVLFVDEAGQMSLADAVAVGTAARSLVLLGDPQQLAQPSKGSHPDGAGASALEHVIGDRFTIPADRGLFLPLTFRMHASVCAFISEVAYEGRLEAAPDRDLQLVDGVAGLWFVPVEHEGDRVRSHAEAAAVAEVFDDLVGKPWTNHLGEESPLVVDDIIVVAPYNAHVAELKRALPAGARVGTVDKFQGGEGAVAIYSMASSSADEAPRGMTFLYDLHRLNVAVSRARARAYVVASPDLLHVLCDNPEQLRLANALCRYVEYADARLPSA